MKRLKHETVLSALNLGKVIADGSARVNTFCPIVVPPKPVLAKGAVVAPVPPFAIATVPVTFPAVVAVPAFPVTLPVIGLVTVKFAKVPTEVSEEERTFEASVAPVKVVASATAVMVILPVPSNGTPLMFLAVASLVAVAALPVTLPAIGAVTVSPLKVPTEVIAG